MGFSFFLVWRAVISFLLKIYTILTFEAEYDRFSFIKHELFICKSFKWQVITFYHCSHVWPKKTDRQTDWLTESNALNQQIAQIYQAFSSYRISGREQIRLWPGHPGEEWIIEINIYRVFDRSIHCMHCVGGSYALTVGLQQMPIKIGSRMASGRWFQPGKERWMTRT